MANSNGSSKKPDPRAYPDIGITPRFVSKLGRYFKKSDFEQDSPVIWEESRYAAALFGFLFYDSLNNKRVNTATLEMLEFLVHRSLNEIGQQRAGVYVACLVRDWKRKSWIKACDRGGTLTLTRDGTEQITKINAGRRGAILFAQGPVSEGGRLKIVSILCRTIIFLTLILAGTLILLDVVAIAGGVVETYTNPTKLLKKLPIVGEWF
jgi:hypothetical protein